MNNWEILKRRHTLKLLQITDLLSENCIFPFIRVKSGGSALQAAKETQETGYKPEIRKKKFDFPN